jgi:hypothetical protein
MTTVIAAGPDEFARNILAATWKVSDEERKADPVSVRARDTALTTLASAEEAYRKIDQNRDLTAAGRQRERAAVVADATARLEALDAEHDRRLSDHLEGWGRLVGSLLPRPTDPLIAGRHAEIRSRFAALSDGERFELFSAPETLDAETAVALLHAPALSVKIPADLREKLERRAMEEALPKAVARWDAEKAVMQRARGVLRFGLGVVREVQAGL